LVSESVPLLLATRSPDKLREIRQILNGVGRPIVSLADAGIEPAPEEGGIETFDSFLENALAKARYFQRLTGLRTLADDSGICAVALDGRPGVRSKRFSGRNDLAGDDLDRANNRSLVDALAGTTGVDRTVRYVCAAVCVTSGSAWTGAIGTVAGRLLDEPRGSAGFGYDPLFFLPPIGRTFAELDPGHKHQLSHRGRAFRALALALR
jgi:XTP/dITP diphosphohydrolase